MDSTLSTTSQPTTPPESTSTAQASIPDNGSSLSSGGIAGIAVGAAVGILLSLSVMAWYFARHRKRSIPDPKDIDSPHDFYTHDTKDVEPVKTVSGYSQLPVTEMHGGLQQPQETYSNNQPRYERLSITPDTPETHGRVWYANESYDYVRYVQAMDILK